VIGAGFGGIALAVRLQAAGVSTTLVEKRDKPGGRAYVYEDEGFVFDAGPTVITDPSALEELFTAAGRRMADYVTLVPVSPFYRLRWEDGYRFDYVNDQDALDRQIRAKSPKDVEGYRRFLAYSTEVLEEGYVKLGAVPFLHFRDMVRAGPQLARLQAWRSVYSIVSRFIEDEQLREAFSFHSLLVGGNPFETSSIYALIHALERRWGVWFALGGTGALVDGLVRLFRDIGGHVRLDSPVDEIRVVDGRTSAVVLRGGEVLAADLVASNADVVHTYGHMLRGTERGGNEARRLKRKRSSMSLFVIYFGLKRPPPPELAHHTVCFGPRYRGLIDEIFRRETLAEDFSLYLIRRRSPTPRSRPRGPALITCCRRSAPRQRRSGLGAEGPKYRDRILRYLEERYIPGLSRDLVTSRIFTPHDFRDELNAHLGSAFSLEPILTQSAWFRPHNRDPVIPNLYLVGAGTHPGAGVPGVVGSAKATARVILEDLSRA
jgi:phytoene desaturase